MFTGFQKNYLKCHHIVCVCVCVSRYECCAKLTVSVLNMEKWQKCLTKQSFTSQSVRWYLHEKDNALQSVTNTFRVWLELGRRMLYIPLSVTPERRISAQSLKFSGSPSGTLEISWKQKTCKDLFTDGNLVGFAHKSQPHMWVFSCSVSALVNVVYEIWITSCSSWYFSWKIICFEAKLQLLCLHEILFSFLHWGNNESSECNL